MFREEAIWIKNALQKIEPKSDCNEVANIGSSTEYFRKVIQPHIHEHIVNSLEVTGWNVFHVDLKKEAGVDLVADVTKPDFSNPFQDKFALTICTNLLEHVVDINLVVKNLISITRNRGYLLITVPYKYKIHHDPIDNGFRPTPFMIAERVQRAGSNYSIVDEKVITIEDKDYYRVKKSRIPFWGHRERLGYYLGKKHKVSGILLQINKN